MRKVIFNMMMTLDGFFEGPNGEIDWHCSVDTLIFGRKTYQLMADYWPSAPADKIADNMNNLPKIVFSKTLQKVEWKNSRLAKEHIAEEISTLKQQPGKDMVMFGSAGLATSFMNMGLIDEYQILVNPIVLGNGKPLFKDLNQRHPLKLIKTKTRNSGVVEL